MKKFKILTCLVLVAFSVLAFASCDMTIGHTYGEDYLYDADGHWHECTSEECDAVTSAEPHKFEVVGDENVCVCGYKQTVATVNDDAFTSLAAAVAAAEAEDTVYVVADTTVVSNITVDKAIAIVGQGDVTVSREVEAGASSQYIFVVASDDVAIVDINFEYATDTRDNAMVFVLNGDVYVEGCSFIGVADEIDQSIGVLAAYATGDIEVSDSLFANLKYGIYANGAATVDVQDCEFDNINYNAINVAGDSASYPTTSAIVKNNILTDISVANYGHYAYSSGIYFGNAVTGIEVEGNDVTMLNNKLAIVANVNGKDKLLEVAANGVSGVEYVLAGNVQLDATLVIAAPITLNGNGKTVSTTYADSDIIVVTSDNVTLKNIVVDGKISETAEAVKGVQFYNVNDCAVADVTVKNVTKVGLLINAADVTATGTITLENTGWSDAMQINVGYGTDATNDACVFDFSAATLVGVTEVYADAGDNTRATANGVTITITAAEGWAVNAEAAEGVTSYKPAQA